jgi:hypothetical protein
MAAGNHHLVPIPNVRLVITRLMISVVFKLRLSGAKMWNRQPDPQKIYGVAVFNPQKVSLTGRRPLAAA